MEEGGAGVVDATCGGADRAFGAWIADESNAEVGTVIINDSLDRGALGGVEGGSEGNEEFVGRCWMDGVRRGRGEGSGCGEGARGGEHYGGVVLDLAEAAAGVEAD